MPRKRVPKGPTGDLSTRTNSAGLTPTAIASGLEPPWSSAPARNPRYVLYLDHDESGRRWIVNSYGLYAIKKILDLVEDMTADFSVRSEQLAEIRAHKYTKAEAEWQLPSNYVEDARQFATGKRRP
jgi:hypothetical protein